MAQHPLKDGLHPGLLSTLTPWDPGNEASIQDTFMPNLNTNLRPHPPGVVRGEEKVKNNVKEIKKGEDNILYRTQCLIMWK